MVYITIDKVRSMCNKLGAQQVPDNEVQDFIQKACAKIDIILGSRYRLPLPSPTPGIIESIAQDYAAAFVVEKYYTGTISKEQIPQSKVYYDRAEKDLKDVIDLKLLDGISGIVLISQPAEQIARPCIKSTTYKQRSAMEEALNKF